MHLLKNYFQENMKRILFIKLTSLGDLIHALPALSDASFVYPELQIDWVIDDNFQEVATWHPAVQQIFTTNHRQWGKSLRHLGTYRAIYALAKKLRKNHYDLVIDGQGNFKTALLSLLTKGLRVGFDKNSVREKLVYLAYQKRYAVAKQAHAIDRLRQLFSLALDYPLPTVAPNFKIAEERLLKPSIELPSSYLFFVHNASWVTKLWPENHWVELIKLAVQAGYPILLPWGNVEEKARAERLAAVHPQVIVLPKLSLSEIGYVLTRAKACVCMDTGLSHLAAALNVPAITLYGATDSGLIGASGEQQFHFQSTVSCAPCNKKQCLYPNPSALANPPCLAQIQPSTVFKQLRELI